MTVAQLMAEMDSAEIAEWMAHDMLKDTETRERLEADSMTPEQTDAALLALFRGKQ